LSYPKSLIGYPETIEKTGFPLNRLREWRLKVWRYTQTL